MIPSISVIIVNYNAGNFLANCVNSVMYSDLDVEIIVVDNASSDESLIGLSVFENICIIRNSTNLGFSAACNIGINTATSDFILFINPDCIVQKNSILTLLSTLSKNDQVGMVGGLITNTDGTEQVGGRRSIPTPWRSFVNIVGLARFANRWPRLFFNFNMNNQPLPFNAVEVEAISGACVMVSRIALSDVGNWDEGYFLHCEDLDLCMRFRQKGWKILFVPMAKIIHAKGVCSASNPLLVEWHKHRGMMRFYIKFFRYQYPGILMWLVACGVWSRFTVLVIYHFLVKFKRLIRLNISDAKYKI